MDVSLKWLGKYVDISEYTPKDLADKITVSGVEVESIKYLAQGTNLVIGQVLECVPHPDSDHLHVTKVNVGTDVLQIVCGAPNVAKGQKVIVSLPGAYLPAKDITIQKGSIRGVESNGMICSLVELGVDKKYLSEAQQNGIEVLSDDAKVGDTNPLGFLGLDDVIFELKPTPNRGDVLSVESFAYELAAAINKSVKLEDKNIKFEKLEKSSYKVDSKTSSCHLFSIKGVKGVKIKESPKWLKEALLGCSIRPINNVVDIGNYVMLLTGQPLHMYDADKIASKEFVVRDDFAEKFPFGLSGKAIIHERAVTRVGLLLYIDGCRVLPFQFRVGLEGYFRGISYAVVLNHYPGGGEYGDFSGDVVNHFCRVICGQS